MSLSVDEFAYLASCANTTDELFQHFETAIAALSLFKTTLPAH